MRKTTQQPQIFVLTPEEKTTICFVLIAFVLGFGAKRYREVYSDRPAKTAIVATAKSAGLPAEKRAEAKRRKSPK